MKIGLIARADSTGLGHQTWEFYNHMQPAKTLIIDLCHLSPKNLVLHPDRFPNAVVQEGIPDDNALEDFVQGLDILYTAETPYNHNLFALADQHSVKTVLHVNPEFNMYHFRPDLPRPTVFAAPTHWMYDTIPDPKIVLPVPINLDRFDSTPSSEGEVKFLHVVGNPAIHDRAGTRDLLAALQHITVPCTITMKCQEPGYLSALITELRLPKAPGVNLVIDSSNSENYWDLYTGHDVLVHPRRFGGLNLPAQEALAAGLAVIMPAIPPNGDLIPGDWLFMSKHYGQFMAQLPVDLYRTEPETLAAMIDRFADREYCDSQRARAHLYAEPFSWEVQKPAYESIFENIIAQNIPVNA